MINLSYRILYKIYPFKRKQILNFDLFFLAKFAAIPKSCLKKKNTETDGLKVPKIKPSSKRKC